MSTIVSDVCIIKTIHAQNGQWSVTVQVIESGSATVFNGTSRHISREEAIKAAICQAFAIPQNVEIVEEYGVDSAIFTNRIIGTKKESKQYGYFDRIVEGYCLICLEIHHRLQTEPVTTKRMINA